MAALFFFFKALLWGLLLYFSARHFTAEPFWFVVLSVLVFSLPIVLYGLYHGTVRKIQRLPLLKKQGWLHFLLSGRFLVAVLQTLWGLAAAFFMLVQFYRYQSLEWLVFFMVVPVFAVVFAMVRRLLAHELKPYVLTAMALRVTNLIVPLLMLLVVGAVFWYSGAFPAFASLTDAINTQKAGLASGSALVDSVAQPLAFYDGVKAYVLGRLDSIEKSWTLAIFAVGEWVLFYNACLTLSALRIPAKEYRRVASPLSDTDQPPPLSAKYVAMISGVFVFVVLFVYVPSAAYLELWSQEHRAETIETRLRAETIVVQKLEQIDAEYFQPGTLAQLQTARVEALRQMDASLSHLDNQAAQAFDLLEANVDVYLDWYYSLVGEYTRIANLLMGELEDYMADKLEKALRQGEPFQNFERSLNTALADYEAAQTAYHQAAEKIMLENRVKPSEHIQVTQQMSLQDVLNPPVHQDMIGLQQRLMTAGGGGALAGIVTALVIKKVVAKIIAKNTLKVAAKALTKIIIGKTAGSAGGAAAGAATGAAIGSVVPGVGTAIGAALGGILGGMAVGVSVDSLLIALEESMNREQFKQEILAAIGEAEAEFRGSFNQAPSS